MFARVSHNTWWQQWWHRFTKPKWDLLGIAIIWNGVLWIFSVEKVRIKKKIPPIVFLSFSPFIISKCMLGHEHMVIVQPSGCQPLQCMLGYIRSTLCTVHGRVCKKLCPPLESREWFWTQSLPQIHSVPEKEAEEKRNMRVLTGVGNIAAHLLCFWWEWRAALGIETVAAGGLRLSPSEHRVHFHCCCFLLLFKFLKCFFFTFQVWQLFRPTGLQPTSVTLSAGASSCRRWMDEFDLILDQQSQ